MATIDASNADVGPAIDDGSLLLSHLHKFELITSSSDETTSTPTTKLRLMLASQSPRRREILDLMGLSGRYKAQPSPLDEEALQIELAERKNDYTPQWYALELAERKAHAMAITLLPQNYTNNDDDVKITLVIGSDTIVDLDGEIMNKPTNGADAYTMLKNLSGKWHKVHTGLAIYVVGAKHIIGHDVFLMESHTDTASVKFANLTDSDIHAYIATKEPMDKAGSYGIQGVGGQFVERLEGDYFTIMGLSMHRLGKELAQTILALGI